MARRSIASAVMLASLGALAAKPVDAEKGASVTGPAPDPSPVDAQLADLTARLVDAEKALTTAHESYEKQLADMRAEHDAQIVDLTARFDAAWKRREEEIAERFRVMRESAAPLVIPEGTLPSTAPVRGRAQRFAAALIHCHDGAGAKLAIRAGEAIPEDADLTGVHPTAIEER
jgi:hypothetical protein